MTITVSWLGGRQTPRFNQQQSMSRKSSNRYSSTKSCKLEDLEIFGKISSGVGNGWTNKMCLIFRMFPQFTIKCIVCFGHWEEVANSCVLADVDTQYRGFCVKKLEDINCVLHHEYSLVSDTMHYAPAQYDEYCTQLLTGKQQWWPLDWMEAVDLIK